MIPENLRPFFWDIDPESFEPRSYLEYTVGRILEHGNIEAILWMRLQFPSELIVGAIRSDRRLTRKSAKFWALVYRVPEEEVAALKRSGQDQSRLDEAESECTQSPGIRALYRPASPIYRGKR